MEEQIRQYFIDKYDRYYDVSKIKFFEFCGEDQLPNICIKINGTSHLFNVTEIDFNIWKNQTRRNKLNKLLDGV